MCYLLVENRKDVSKGGLIHICTFVLLKLSGERLFGVAINKPYTVRLPTDLPLFTGERGRGGGGDTKGRSAQISTARHAERVAGHGPKNLRAS